MMPSTRSSATDLLIEPMAKAKAATIARNASTGSSTSNMCVGTRLRERRISRGIREGEICAKLEIDRNDLDTYEEGMKRINANLLLRIAKLLDVGPDYFFRDYTAAELSACLESPCK